MQLSVMKVRGPSKKHKKCRKDAPDSRILDDRSQHIVSRPFRRDELNHD